MVCALRQLYFCMAAKRPPDPLRGCLLYTPRLGNLVHTQGACQGTGILLTLMTLTLAISVNSPNHTVVPTHKRQEPKDKTEGQYRNSTAGALLWPHLCRSFYPMGYGDSFCPILLVLPLSPQDPRPVPPLCDLLPSQVGEWLLGAGLVHSLSGTPLPQGKPEVDL